MFFSMNSLKKREKIFEIQKQKYRIYQVQKKYDVVGDKKTKKQTNHLNIPLTCHPPTQTLYIKPHG